MLFEMKQSDSDDEIGKLTRDLKMMLLASLLSVRTLGL